MRAFTKVNGALCDKTNRATGSFYITHLFIQHQKICILVIANYLQFSLLPKMRVSPAVLSITLGM